ncbi:MAG: response regulator [Bryobacteraceae bacterium]|jgi:CheY-like chemotaxis protein
MQPIEVLLIEDNPGDAFLVRLILAESQTPVRVHLAQDGMEALLILASDVVHPDLIIVDLNLPHISGHQVMERYRQNDIPVVVFSSSWDDEDRRRALALGAREFVRKPLGAQEYRAAVCAMVDKWALRREQPAPAGPAQYQRAEPKSKRTRPTARKSSGKYSTQNAT